MPRLAQFAFMAFALFAAAPMLSETAAAEDKAVNIYFWFEYVPPETITDFEKATGAKVVYDNFDSVEMLTTKVLTGKSGYDLVMPGASTVGHYIKAGAIQKLDKTKIPNAKDLNPSVMAFLSRQDPGNEYAIPYAYGTTGIIHNPAKIADRMKDAPVDSLDIIFKPEIAAKFKDCGIAVVDAPEGVMSVALNYLGFNPFSTNEDEIKKAGDLLHAAKPNIRHFKTGSIISEFAQGDLCLALGWSGDAITAAARAEEAKNGVEVSYAIPKEGTEIFFDVITVPADAPHLDDAHAFLNFLLSPEISARFTNTILYPNAVETAKPLIEESIRSNPNVYLSQETMKRLFVAEPRDPKSLRTVTRLWTDFTSGSQ